MAAVTPSSVRFEPRVLERLTAFVAVHREMSLSSASNRLVDEALRMHEHPLITFKDGPAGRRARLVGGPDVWEVIGAVRSVRESDPALAGDEVLGVVAETSGVPMGSTAGPSSPTPCCAPCRTWRSSRPRCSRAGSL